MHKKPGCVAVIFALIIGLAISGFPAIADATFMMRVSDGVVTKTIEDEVAGPDGDNALGLAGVMNFSGSVGAFLLSVNTGSSKPVVGSATDPQMTLTSTDISTAVASTLTIELTDTDFGPTASPLDFDNFVNSAFSGTGTVTYEAWIDNTNAAFGMGQQIISLGPDSGIFNLSGRGTVIPGNPFSLTMKITVAHDAPGFQQSQFDASIKALPLPSTALLFGFGLFGFAACTCWRRKENHRK